MASISLREVFVEIPVFNAKGRSLSSKILEAATGGIVDSDPQGKVLVTALQDVTLQLSDGDRLGIVGHNGSGKSTLLRVLSRVYSPTRGSVDIQGDIKSLIELSVGINPEATGRENISLRGALLGMSKSDINRHYEGIVDFSELGDFINLPLRTYSWGMQLRLAFAISTFMPSEILIMDEWLSVGDIGFKDKASRQMAKAISDSKILVLASHSRDVLEQTVDRVLWLEHGKVKMLGPTLEVTKEYFGSGTNHE